MQIVPQYLPQTFGALFLSFALILTLAPYLFGHDFGIFKIPDLGPSMRQRLKWIGPSVLILGILIHIPFGPALCEKPVYEMVQDKELCGTTTVEYVVTPERPKTCRDVDFGQEGWNRTKTINGSSGWQPGGSNPTNWCNQLTASFISSRSIGPAHDSEVLAKSQEVKKDWKGHVTYNYHCTVKMRWEPVYAERTHPKCGMWPAEKDRKEEVAQCKKQVGTRKVACDA